MTDALIFMTVLIGVCIALPIACLAILIIGFIAEIMIDAIPEWIKAAFGLICLGIAAFAITAKIVGV